MTLEELSMKYFGTTNYKSILDVLAPSSMPVRYFMAEVKKYKLDI